ncbi:MAG: NapC/NirT family cytochrome c [Gammaproteobacteria bacterium]|nr:NapC/NirT family cytochrome c [Gammaproteobacteria bacterium]
MKKAITLSIKRVISKQTHLWCSIGLMTLGLFISSSAFAEGLKNLEDCESCHTVQASEFQASVHYINRSGVQAGCNNCHADQKHKNGKKTSKVVKKDRLDMAMSEWKRMSDNDSKECKTCHSTMAMDLAKQEPRSVARHEESFDDGDTSCINCHKGISHYLPAGWKAKAQKVGLQK